MTFHLERTSIIHSIQDNYVLYISIITGAYLGRELSNVSRNLMHQSIGKI